MRAMKIFSTTALCFTCLPVLAGTLTCNASNDSYKHCNLSRANERDIRIVKATSDGCDMNNTWGVDSTGIWVDHGCSAIFNYSELSSNNYGNAGGIDETNVYVEPGYVEPFYWPGLFFEAGLLGAEYGAAYGNGWYGNNYYNHNYNNNYQNYNHNYNHNPANNNFHNANGFNNNNVHANQQEFHPQHEEENEHEHEGEESHEHEEEGGHAFHGGSYHGRRGHR